MKEGLNKMVGEKISTGQIESLLNSLKGLDAEQFRVFIYSALVDYANNVNQVAFPDEQGVLDKVNRDVFVKMAELIQGSHKTNSFNRLMLLPIFSELEAEKSIFEYNKEQNDLIDSVGEEGDFRDEFIAPEED